MFGVCRPHKVRGSEGLRPETQTMDVCMPRHLKAKASVNATIVASQMPQDCFAGGRLITKTVHSEAKSLAELKSATCASGRKKNSTQETLTRIERSQAERELDSSFRQLGPHQLRFRV